MISNCPQCQRFINDKCTALNSLQILNGTCNKYSPDNISYKQHKLYRSILLPALTEALGENNNSYVHTFILKPEYIYRMTGEYYFKVNSFDEVPEKYQKSSQTRYITGTVNVKNKYAIIGYIPSMADFTKRETKDFFRFCEIMLDELSGSIPIEHNQEYSELRRELLI